MVDNSQTPLEPLPQIRRGLQQFIDALPPNHELMLVTTGGTMNIRVQPTRDYLEVSQSGRRDQLHALERQRAHRLDSGGLRPLSSNCRAPLSDDRHRLDRWRRFQPARHRQDRQRDAAGIDEDRRAGQCRAAHLDRHQPHPQHHARDDQAHRRRVRVGDDRHRAAGADEGDGRAHLRSNTRRFARQSAAEDFKRLAPRPKKRAAGISPGGPFLLSTYLLHLSIPRALRPSSSASCADWPARGRLHRSASRWCRSCRRRRRC